MAEEPVILKSSEGVERPGTAEVVRYGAGIRTTKAIGFVVGGLLFGAACIIVPVLHLFTTWGLPLLGIILAVRSLRREVVVESATGTCPSCEASITLPGGAGDDGTARTCPQCGGALELVVSAPPASGPGADA